MSSLSALSRIWHPHTMAEPSWLNPFFPPQKRCIAVFLQTVNVGTITTPPSLVPLGRKTPFGSTSRNGTSMSSSQPMQCRINVPRVIIWSKDDSANKGRTRTKANNTLTTLCNRFGPKLRMLTTTPTAPGSPTSCPSTSPVQTATTLATIE